MLKEIIETQSSTDLSALPVNFQLEELHISVMNAFQSAVQGKEMQILEHWNPGATNDLVEYSTDILLAFAFLNLFRLNPNFVCVSVLKPY